MNVIIHGRVTLQHLADAELFEAIVPTGFVTDGRCKPPIDLPTKEIPVDPKVSGDLGIAQQNARFALNGDALVLVGKNPRLVEAVSRLRLPIYQVDQ